jgi:hypothetical protein
MSISFQVGQLAGLHNKIDVNLLHVVIIVTNPDSIITPYRYVIIQSTKPI